jgi:HrpA-like RNA helicase
MDLFMKDQTTPELQRVPLEEVCLSILAGNLSNKCVDFLMLAPQPPPLDAITLALKKLDEVGAIQIVHGYEALTPMGQHMAKLPVHVRLAKMLIFGAIFQCLDPILTIAASLSGKSPFVNTVTDSTRAEAAHRTFRHETSDFMTYVNLWQAFQREFSKDQGRSFCRNNYISLAVMVEIDDLRRQNLELLSQIGFVQGSLSDVSKSWYNVHGSNERVVHAVICAGLYANIAHAIKNGIDDPPTLWHGQERLHFHPSSVNYGKKKLPQDWIVFHEKFAASNKATVSATCLISPLALVLFGGNLVVKHVERKVVVDDWIELNIAAQTGVKLREMRRKLDPLVLRWMERTATDITNDMVDGIVKLLSED